VPAAAPAGVSRVRRRPCLEISSVEDAIAVRGRNEEVVTERRMGGEGEEKKQLSSNERPMSAIGTVMCMSVLCL
jgi:hypothetical protein